MRDPLERREFMKAIGFGSAAAALGIGGASGSAAGDGGAAAQPPERDGIFVAGAVGGPEEFPFRPLIEPDYERSMMKRYLEKEVRESVPLDDMEADRGWRLVDGRGEMHYTHEIARTGTRSLQLTIPTRDEAVMRAGSRNGSLRSYRADVVAAIDFATPQDWSRYNRISLWVYVHPATMHSYAFNLDFRCEGFTPGPVAPLPVHFIQDLEPGRWNLIVWEFPDLPRDKVVGFDIVDMVHAFQPGEGGTYVYNIDRIDLERVEAEKFAGWEVAPGRISFHHIGYRPSGAKMALTTGTGAAEFELVEAVSGKTAARLPVQPFRTTKGSFEALDFSSFTTPGRYLLRCGKAASGPFEIAEEVWYGTVQKVLNFYYGMRCGFPVPGVHGVCHADLRGQRDDVLKVINGGWHDAGDLSQGSHRTGASLYAMTRTFEELSRRDAAPALRQRLMEEMRWGLDWLLKTRFGDGFRIDWAVANVYTDNVIGTSDDTIVQARSTPFENFLFCAVAAHTSKVLEKADPARSKAALQAAREDYLATMQQQPDWVDAGRDEAAFGALAAVQLYRATGDGRYAADAVGFGGLLLRCQEQAFVDGIPIAGYYYTDTSRQRVVHDHHLSFEGAPGLALEALCEALPGHESWMEWYAAALLHSQYFLAQGAAVSAPFNMLPNSVWRRDELDGLAGQGWRRAPADPEQLKRQFEDGTPLGGDYRLRTFPLWVDNRFHGATACQMSATLALSAAARLRNSPTLQELVEQQLQWVLGRNPFSQSLMYGEGFDWQPHFAFCLRDLVGALPVGMDSRADDAPWWTAYNDSTYKEIWVVPVSRFLWNLAYTAVPALVQGRAAQPATFTHARTGQMTTASGDFSLSVAPGAYTITCGALSRKMDLLGGSHYALALEPANWIDFQLAADGPDAGGKVRLTASVRGTGEHDLTVRVFNAAVDDPIRSVSLSGGAAQTVSWELRAGAKDKPWAALVTPDGDAGGRREAFGTFTKLAKIGT
jgi:hypothetical protein